MTEGSPLTLILKFTLPLLCANLFQQLYNIADSLIVSYTISPSALAAVGSTGSVMFLIVGFAVGLTQGVAIVTSQRYGSDDPDGVRRSFALGIMLCGAVAVVLTVIAVPLTRGILILMNTPADILDMSEAYLRWIFMGIPTTMLFNIMAAMLRAVGDSRTPLYFLTASCLINIGLDFLFILGLNMGTGGAGLATPISQMCAGVACVVYTYKKIPVLRLRKSDWKITREELAAHSRIGFPIAFQSSIIAIGTIAVQYALNGLGTQNVTAYTTAQKITPFAMFPLQSVGMTMGTFAAQNYGAGKFDRIKAGLKRCVLLGIGASVVFGLVFWLFGYQISMLFTAGDVEISKLSHLCLKVDGSLYVLLATLFVFRFTLQGLGNSLIPTLAGIIELVMRVGAVTLFASRIGLLGVSIAGPAAWLGALVTLSVAVIPTIKRMSGRLTDGDNI